MKVGTFQNLSSSSWGWIDDFMLDEHRLLCVLENLKVKWCGGDNKYARYEVIVCF